MTNGEKMISAFPNGEVRKCEKGVVFSTGGWCHAYADEWWNAECEEPTTKNNLGVDLISRADAIQAMQNKAKKLTNEDTINGLCGAVAILFDLPSVTPQLSVPEITALAEWTEKLTKECEEAYNKGYEAGRKELEPITSKDKFIYALTACGCLLKDGKTWYEHNELIKCFEDLGLFEQETKNCSDCKIVQTCVEAGIRSTSKALSILDKIRAEIESYKLSIDDIVTKDGIDKKFMNWLWNKDRQKYALILFGHLELITDDLVKEYIESEGEDGNDD